VSEYQNEKNSNHRLMINERDFNHSYLIKFNIVLNFFSFF